jgi:ribA/ribD-fused uncharacterized protein
MKRCPKGIRKNRKTGECEPVPRCPRESRKNPKTGLCRKIELNVPSEPKSKTPLTNTKTPHTMVLQFHSKSALLKNHILPPDALRRLSNFSEDSVEYDGNVYPTVEHAYQAQKYMCSNKPELVQMFYNGTIQTAKDAKTAGGKAGMKKYGAALDLECWNQNQDNIMMALIESKIRRNEYIRSILKIVYENNVKLVHFSRTDMYWGAHVNPDGSIKTGLNKLGEIYNLLKNINKR